MLGLYFIRLWLKQHFPENYFTDNNSNDILSEIKPYQYYDFFLLWALFRNVDVGLQSSRTHEIGRYFHHLLFLQWEYFCLSHSQKITKVVRCDWKLFCLCYVVYVLTLIPRIGAKNAMILSREVSDRDGLCIDVKNFCWIVHRCSRE